MSATVDRLLAAREQVIAEGLAILGRAGDENRDLEPDEELKLGQIHKDAKRRQLRIDEIETMEAERAVAAEARAPHLDVIGDTSRSSGMSSYTYRPGSEFSYFRDLVSATHGDGAAIYRLQANERAGMERPEYRAGTTGLTSFGAMIPPVWLIDEVATLARAGRATADLFRAGGPPTSTSMVIPQITTGSVTAIQNPENTTLGTQDVVMAQITRPTSTIGGYLDLSLQSLELAPESAAVDRMVFADLVADYNKQLDSQCIIGTGASNQLLGLDNVAGVNAVTSVQASPTVALVLPRIADAIQQVESARFLPPDGILMHPRRWAWFLAAVDSTGRPLVDAEGAPMNASGIANVPLKAEGSVGTLAGLPVYTDANIPTTIVATQDEIYVARFSDGILFESPPRLEVFRDVGSASGVVRLRCYGFLNLFAARYPAGISRIRGTGLAAPSFGT